MDISFTEYLKLGTQRITEILSSPDISEEERQAVVSAFSEELTANIGNTEGLNEFEPLIYAAYAKTLDKEISEVLSKTDPSYQDYETGIRACDCLQSLLNMFTKKNWTLPYLINTVPEKCSDFFRKKQESVSLSGKIAETDRQISELLLIAQNELRVSTCDRILELAEEQAQDIVLCKKKRTPLPSINNKDIKRLKKAVTELRKTAEKKETLHQESYETDLQIQNLVSLQNNTAEECRNVISLCRRQAVLLAECEKKKWPLPSIRYIKPDETVKQYTQYLSMLELDHAISQERNLLSSNRQYKAFFSHCAAQQDYLSACIQNGWKVPDLINSDPAKLSSMVKIEKSKKDKQKRLKRRLILAGVFFAAIAISLLYFVNKSREGKIKTPFASSYVVGQNYDVIYEELKKAGFENISSKSDDSGWLDSNQVIGVTIDNSTDFSKGSYWEPDVSVVITYSSSDRVYITDILKNWKSSNYESVEKTLQRAGLTNITVEEIITADKTQDNQTAAISLNGELFTNEYCYIPKNAPVVISYYSLQVGIGNDSTEFIGQEYKKVVKSLEDSGFRNVQTQKVTSGWAKGNTVVGVTVNNVDTYNSSESFDPDVKIVVKYSSDDRIDVTEIVKEWQSADYENLQTALQEKGFTAIKLFEKATEEKNRDRLVAGIHVNKEEYIAGDCYLPKNSSIQIDYYCLQIRIGKTAKAFIKGEQYNDVVKQLKTMGFTNIHLQRANDIGWFPIHAKEGTIKSIQISENKDFTENDSFKKDDEILVIVHTRKNEGCEDITEIAD